MPKKKEGKGTNVTLKAAKNAIQTTLSGGERLILSKMGIVIFPKCLVKLTKVDDFDLSRNLMATLPNNIGVLSSLKWLDLHSNKLTSLPETIGNLVALTHLNLSNNCLTSEGLPSTLGNLTSLESLNLGLNQLDSLPPSMENLRSLQELSLFDNRFVTLPEFLNDLPKLTKLNTERNPVSEKSKVEEEICLVHESSLCKPCLKRCKEDNGLYIAEEEEEEEEDVYMVEEKRTRTYPGLMVPNSVAKVNQDAWRIRAVENN